MAYDLSYLRERLYEDFLDDDSLPTALVDRFINDSQREIFNSVKLPFMEKVFAGTISASQHIFTFPDDYKEAQSLIITAPEGSQRNLTDYYVPFREFNRRFPEPSLNGITAPTLWTLHANKLYFSGPTDQTYTMTLYYYKRPKKLEVDGDIPEVPEDFEEALLLGAHSRVLKRNEDYDLARAVKADFQEQINMLTPNYGGRQSGKPTIMGKPMNSYRRG